MSTTSVVYPEFVENQVLTSDQLNDLREQLDEQDRQGRVHLVGVGRVCGLEWRLDVSDLELTLSEGFGVTSDGYLIKSDEATFTHCRAYEDPDQNETEEGKDPNYQAWSLPGDARGQIDILELLTDDAEEGATAISEADLTGRVVVLYLERKPVEQRSCLVTDCDNKGLNIHLRLRVLLVPRANLTEVAPCPAPPPRLRIPRLHTEVDLCGVATAADINAGYSRIILGSVDRVQECLDRVFSPEDGYAGFLGLPDAVTEGVAGFSELLGNENHQQYHYDALRDVAAACNEAVSAACELLTDCCPQADFPRHLMIGAVEAEADGTTLREVPDRSAGYAHEFRPSAVANVAHGDLVRVRSLFLRIFAMVQSLALAGDGEIRLTPSHTRRHALGRGAVPFYFPAPGDGNGAGVSIADHWQPTLCCTTDTLWSYQRIAGGEAGGNRDGALGSDGDLLLDYEACSLIRIEPVLAKDAGDAAGDIAAARDATNAEFHLVRSFLDDPFSDEREVRDLIGGALTQWLEALRNLKERLVAIGLESDRGDGLEEVDRLIEESRRVRAGLGDEALKLEQAAALHGPVCDYSHLEADYLARRSEILCVLRGALEDVARVGRWALGEPLDDAAYNERAKPVERGTNLLLYEAIAGRVLDQPDADGSELTFEGRVQELLEMGLAPGARLLLAIRETARSLPDAVARLLEGTLPGRLAAFDYALYGAGQRQVLGRITHLLLACELWQAVAGDLVPEGDDAFRRWMARTQAEQARRSLWQSLHLCKRAGLAMLGSSYLHLLDHDPSWFRNLACSMDGLEHLAGVERCGTFILVCDGDPQSGTVVADFSLSCKLPCCCHVDFSSVCVPPVAQAEHRVVVVEADDEAGKVDLTIDVIRNDFDAGEKEATLEVRLPDGTSELGATLSLDDAGAIVYQMGGPVPGAVDRFAYTLVRSGRACPGEDEGQVQVLFVPARELVQPPEPPEPPQPGTITGTVVTESGEPVLGATVTVAETGSTTLTGAAGGFVFRALTAGRYTLTATVPDLGVSDATTVTVGAGETVSVKLVLPSPVVTGAVVITVLDAARRSPIAGASVRVVREDGGIFGEAVTDAKGVARLSGLQAGAYVATATAIRFAPGNQAFSIADASDIPVNIALRSFNIGGVVMPVDDTFLSVVTDAGLVDGPDIREAVAIELNERMRERLTPFVLPGTVDPLPDASEADEAVLTFVTTSVANPEVKSTQLLTDFRELLTTVEAQGGSAESLAAAGKAFFDRMMVLNPGGFSDNQASQMRRIVRRMDEVGVDMAAFREEWGGAEVNDKLGVPSALAIDEILANR